MKRIYALVVGGFVVGILTPLTIRFASYRPAQVHYHANFAVYLQGQPQKFTNRAYFLDGGCGMSNMMTPESRAHLTPGIDNVVHVKDGAVTWGQFFNNLGWYIGDDFVKTADGQLLAPNGDATLHIIINEQDYTGLGGITNAVIKDRDRLLLSYGNSSRTDLAKQYAAVPSTAKTYDGMKNASACGHATKVTLQDRLRHLL
jgi:hypothetical protein